MIQDIIGKTLVHGLERFVLSGKPQAHMQGTTRRTASERLPDVHSKIDHVVAQQAEVADIDRAQEIALVQVLPVPALDTKLRGIRRIWEVDLRDRVQ